MEKVAQNFLLLLQSSKSCPELTIKNSPNLVTLRQSIRKLLV
jgi:hypothetical protein